MPNLYKQILEHIPTAAIAVDKNLRVLFANRAFREYFRSDSERGTLRGVIGCGETSACGKGARCRFCSLRALFAETMASGKPASRKLVLRQRTDGDLAIRMKAFPMEGYFLGIADDAYETEIAREMSSAQDIQQRLLPPATPHGGVPYSFLYIPCREIGGDLPDVYRVNGETMGVIADVSGKGISAGMLSAFVKAGWDRSEPSPARAVKGLNAKFLELNLDERAYVTAAAVRIERESMRLIYCVAGHNAPLLLKGAGGIDEIVMKAPPVSNWIPDFPYEDASIGYSHGDILVLLTDGVTESKNKKGEQFSIERVEAILQRAGSAEEFISLLKTALKDFCGDFDDDLTAIAFDL